MAVSVVPHVRRLAQYRPFERGGLDLRAVLRDLVLAVAAIGDGAVESLFECRKAFVDLWGLEVEIDELRPVVEELMAEGLIDKNGRGFTLASSTRMDLEGKARQWQEIEDRAFRYWELAVRLLQPAIADQDFGLLKSDLRHWLHLIISRHGAEAALMLYPEDDRARRFFDDVDERGFESLPERSRELRELRRDALPLFIRGPSPDQRRFLAWLLNTSFYMTVLTIDPAAEQLVRAQMDGHRIYLDTNFLYAILGAALPEEVYSSRRLIQMSKELGFEFAITPWTLAELRTSIGRSRRDIEEQKRFVRPELAETMLLTSGDKGFNRLFWQTYKDKKTQPRDVFDRLEHFDKELADYGIVEVCEGCTHIDNQEERVREYASLVGAERWPHSKEFVVLEHDAKCRLLVDDRQWRLVCRRRRPVLLLRVVHGAANATPAVHHRTSSLPSRRRVDQPRGRLDHLVLLSQGRAIPTPRGRSRPVHAAHARRDHRSRGSARASVPRPGGAARRDARQRRATRRDPAGAAWTCRCFRTRRPTSGRACACCGPIICAGKASSALEQPDRPARRGRQQQLLVGAGDGGPHGQG